MFAQTHKFLESIQDIEDEVGLAMEQVRMDEAALGLYIQNCDQARVNTIIGITTWVRGARFRVTNFEVPDELTWWRYRKQVWVPEPMVRCQRLLHDDGPQRFARPIQMWLQDGPGPNHCPNIYQQSGVCIVACFF